MIVAIDGPAGAGKSTVAEALARRLGMGHLNTGSMYRALTWLALEHGVPPGDGPALADLATRHPVRLQAGDGERVLVGEHDVTALIRGPEVNRLVSEVSAHAPVRAAVVAAQRELLREGDWVSDGRDVGSVVWPEAEVKVFLTATVEERARRRQADLAALGVSLGLDQVAADIERRDRLDSTRAESPLVVAPGAVVVDSTRMASQAVVERLARLVERARQPVSRR